MPSMRLEGAGDSLDLSSVARLGYGVEVLAGVTGLGLPPVSAQWLEGAGDGAMFRGRRVQPRDIDLPLLVQARNRAELKSLWSRLALIMAGPATLYWVDGRESDWFVKVNRVGGGDITYGEDTIGNVDLRTVVTFRAGDPYFTQVEMQKRVIAPTAARGLLTGSLANLQLSTSQAIGTITLDNAGDVSAYPVWKVYGPGNDFKAISAQGEQLWWQGTLAAGDVLTIDTRRGAGTVTDQTGANRYDKLAAAPRMWAIPPGITTATASLLNVVPGQTRIECTWQNRRWTVI